MNLCFFRVYFYDSCCCNSNALVYGFHVLVLNTENIKLLARMMIWAQLCLQLDLSWLFSQEVLAHSPFSFFGKHENCNVVKALIEVMLLERILTVTVYGLVVPSSFLTNNDKSLRSLDGQTSAHKFQGSNMTFICGMKWQWIPIVTSTTLFPDRIPKTDLDRSLVIEKRVNRGSFHLFHTLGSGFFSHTARCGCNN